MESQQKKNDRIGFHYYPDSQHFGEKDLDRWLPEMKALGAQWLTMRADKDRLIPEFFIRGLISEGIEPIIHLPLGLDQVHTPQDLTLNLEIYCSWGVKYTVFYDRPNMRSQWETSSWAQQDLVERFIDRFIPLAEEACHHGLIPVFPPLEPGGDFWDTAFLRTSLQSIERRGNQRLINTMAISAYAWASNLPFDWGAGGPERWPGARPYFTPEGEEDQLGFRIFDWYSAISEAVLGKKLPIFLLACGSKPGDNKEQTLTPVDEISHAYRNQQFARLLARESDQSKDGAELESIPENVIAGCFWLLAADEKSPHAAEAWFQGEGKTLRAVQSFQSWLTDRQTDSVKPEKQSPDPNAGRKSPPQTPARINGNSYTIKHYLLLPAYDWGIPEFNLSAVQPYAKKHQATIGVSIEEAMCAEAVTIIGGEPDFPPDTVQNLRAAGCTVLQINGDGTTLATMLETL